MVLPALLGFPLRFTVHRHNFCIHAPKNGSAFRARTKSRTIPARQRAASGEGGKQAAVPSRRINTTPCLFKAGKEPEMRIFPAKKTNLPQEYIAATTIREFFTPLVSRRFSAISSPIFRLIRRRRSLSLYSVLLLLDKFRLPGKICQWSALLVNDQ
jgi:hypothetical protein